MRILQIDESTRQDIQKAIAYAESHKFTTLDIKRIINGQGKPAGDDPGFVTHIHDGYRVVYSLEEQPIGWCKHISISVEALGKYPHELAVKEILKEFGMDSNFEDSENVLQMWLEEDRAINILEKNSCHHKFELDGGPCIKCGLTVVQLME